MINLFQYTAHWGKVMDKVTDIQPVTASGAIKGIGIVIVLCFIALLILGFEFFWGGKWISLSDLE